MRFGFSVNLHTIHRNQVNRQLLACLNTNALDVVNHSDVGHDDSLDFKHRSNAWTFAFVGREVTALVAELLLSRGIRVNNCTSA